MWNWNEREYAALGEDLGLEGLSFSREAPGGFPPLTRRTHRTAEEVLETLLLLHFGEFFGADAVRVAPSRTIGSAPDIVALDRLGRIHLVEAKEGSVDEADFEQALQYGLRYVFHDALNPSTDLFGSARPRAAFREWLAARVCGVWAGERSETLGPGKGGRKLADADSALKRELRDIGPLSNGKNLLWGPAAWQAFGLEERMLATYLLARSKAKQRMKALGSRTARKRLSFPDRERVLPVAEAWLARTCLGDETGVLRTDGLRIDATRSLVLWVIGMDFKPSVIELATKYRSIGMDVRLLRAGVRSPPGEKTWWLFRQGEAFPARDRLEARLRVRAAAADLEADSLPAALQMPLYRVKAPSGKRHPKDGAPLQNPKAVVR